MECNKFYSIREWLQKSNDSTDYSDGAMTSDAESWVTWNGGLNSLQDEALHQVKSTSVSLLLDALNIDMIPRHNSSSCMESGMVTLADLYDDLPSKYLPGRVKELIRIPKMKLFPSWCPDIDAIIYSLDALNLRLPTRVHDIKLHDVVKRSRNRSVNCKASTPVSNLCKRKLDLSASTPMGIPKKPKTSTFQSPHQSPINCTSFVTRILDSSDDITTTTQGNVFANATGVGVEDGKLVEAAGSVDSITSSKIGDIGGGGGRSGLVVKQGGVGKLSEAAGSVGCLTSLRMAEGFGGGVAGKLSEAAGSVDSLTSLRMTEGFAGVGDGRGLRCG